MVQHNSQRERALQFTAITSVEERIDALRTDQCIVSSVYAFIYIIVNKSLSSFSTQEIGGMTNFVDECIETLPVVLEQPRICIDLNLCSVSIKHIHSDLFF